MPAYLGEENLQTQDLLRTPEFFQHDHSGKKSKMEAAAKTALRKAIALKLKALSPSSVTQQSDEVVKAVLRLPQYQASRRISVFLSMPDKEVQTRGIVLDALNSGKTVFVPYTKRGNPHMRMYRLDNVQDYESLDANNWGIPSMPEDTLARREVGDKDLELILVPAVAFSSKTLDRLGHGKGFYDRFISTYEQDNGGKAPFLGKVIPENETSR